MNEWSDYTLPLAVAASMLAAVALRPSWGQSSALIEPDHLGYTVAARSDRSDRGFGDSRVDVEMVLGNAAGDESRRRFSMRTLENADEAVGDKNLIVFESPKDIAGTALLSHSKILDPDDQWLYLPALKRVKRISSVNKSGPFVGSEFAYEDFTALELNQFTYRHWGEQTWEGLACDVIERIPRYEHSGYAKQVAWIDQQADQVRKVEYYDRKDALLKTLHLREYRRYGEKFWRAHALEMVNHQTEKRSALIFDSFQFQVGLNDRDFSKSALRSIR
jgi:outer membrane lipoprotein-sorting protein